MGVHDVLATKKFEERKSLRRKVVFLKILKTEAL